jgi:small conductance mechanosensitive channel
MDETTETTATAIEQGQIWLDKGLDLAIEFGPRVLGVLFIFILGKWLAGKFGRLTAAAVKKGGLDEMLSDFAGSMVRYLILAIAVLAALQMFGIETTSFVAILGAMGFAIGLALQGTLANFSSGVMLLVFRPFDVGDVVDAGGTVGKVETLGLFSTTLCTPDNVLITVPNGQIYGAVIKNMTRRPLRRVDVTVGVAYDADIDQAKAILIDVCKSIDEVVDEPGSDAYLKELGANSVDFQLRAWTEPANYWAVREQLLRRSKYELDKAGVGIPFPQLDLHVHKLPAANA